MADGQAVRLELSSDGVSTMSRSFGTRPSFRFLETAK